MEEATVHRPITKYADGSRVRIRQDRFRAMLVADFLQSRGDDVESLVPADAFKGFRFFALRQPTLLNSSAAAHGVQEPVGRVNAIKVLRYFAAKKSLSDRMVRVTLHARCPSGLVDGDEDCAGVGAIMRADGVYCLCGCHI